MSYTSKPLSVAPVIARSHTNTRTQAPHCRHNTKKKRRQQLAIALTVAEPSMWIAAPSAVNKRRYLGSGRAVSRTLAQEFQLTPEDKVSAVK